MKTPIRQKILSLLMAAVCLVGVFPVSAFAADTAPNTVTLESAEFSSQYTSPSFSGGEVGIHKMVMNVGDQQHVGFCADHGKSMGTSLKSHPWTSPQAVSDPVIKLMMAYYYTHEEGIYNDVCTAKGFAWTWSGEYARYMNAWVQAVCWRALGQGAAINDTTVAIATELMYVSNSLNNTHHNDIYTDTTTMGSTYYAVANEVVTNADAWCDVDVYRYNYAGGGSGSHKPSEVQGMLVGIPKLTPDEMYSITVKKVDASNPTKGLAGATFSISKTDGTFTATGTTGADGKYEFRSLPAGTYAVTETAAPAGYDIDTPEPQYVSVPQTREVEVLFTDTVTSNATGSIRKVDKDTPSRGLAGATIRITGTDNNFSGEYQTGTGGSLQDVPWDTMPVGSYVAEEIGAPAGYILPTPHEKKAFYWDKKTDVSLVFENDSMVKVQLVKKSAEGKLLPNAIFNILKDGQIIGTQATDANGKITVSNITEGFYAFVEVEPPTGYSKMTWPVGAYVSADDIANGGTITVEAVNYKRHSIKIVKTDAMTNQPISGVTFDYYWNNSYMGVTEPTNTRGEIVIENLQTGTYRFVENNPAPHYSANAQEYNVYIDCEKETQNLQSTIKVVNYHLKKVEILKLDPEANTPIPGVVFGYWKDGTYVGTTAPTDANGKVLIPDLDTGLYVFKEVSGPPDYTINPMDYEIYVDVKDMSKDVFSLDIINYEKRTMIIEKEDAVTGQRLEGAKFHVTSTDLNYDEFYTTDATGTIVLRHVKDGTYIIEEVQAPDGYILPEGTNAKQTVVLNPDSENTVTITFKDAPKTCIVINKVDSVTGVGLEGAQFEVSTVQGRLIGYYTTDATGTAYTPRLEPGVYVVKESKAPQGYELDSTPQNAIVVTNDATLLTFKNVPMTTITITKQDATTGKTLPDATFIVKDVNGLCATTEGSYTTGPDGSVTTSPVPTGKYYVYETAAPDGYALNEDPICVWVVAGEKNNAIVKNVELGSISILKSDTNRNPLAGCTFKVETADGAYIGQFTTDGSGEALVPHLKAGVYIVTEISAPVGYEIDTTPQTVVVKDGQISQIKFEDAKKGGLIIHLQDEADGSELANGQFTIMRCIDNTIVATGKTDQAGIWMVGNLTPGKYIITQTYAPDGYTIVDKEKSEFVVAGTNKDVYFKASTAGLVVELVDSRTGETLKEGRFQVTRNSDNIVIGEYETDEDGLALVSRLTPGMYNVECIVVPSGYVLNGEDLQLTHVKANEVAHVTFKATPIAGITIHSVDADTNAPLAGTKFEVWMQNGELVDAYTTDTTGTVQTNKLAPGFYVIKQIFAENGYVAVTAEMTVEVKAGVAVEETFKSVAKGTLKVIALDPSNQSISDMRVTVTKQNGEKVGEYRTGVDGSVTINDLTPGVYVVTETEAPNGYVIKTATQTAQITSTVPAVVEFRHDAIYGLQIKTSVDQTGTPLAGVKYTITKTNGESIGSYTSDAGGLIFVTLEPGVYVVTQVSAPNGYTVDSTPRNVTVVANQVTVTEFILTQLSSIRIRFVDGESSRGIYGIRILLKNSAGSIVDEYTSANDGYIELTKNVEDGKYTLEMISAPDGYTVDSVPRTIKVVNGETTEVTWKCWKNAGQIQVVLTSSDYNKLTGKPAGSPIQGAEFVIMDADTYAIMDTMTTDVTGVAASHGLPIGRYYVKQSGAAAYYAVSTEQLEVKLKIANDVVREKVTNASLNIVVGSTLQSNKAVNAGMTMRYDVTSINNTSDVSLDNFYWHIKVPTDAARISTLYTGNWNNTVNYRIEYKTNMRDYTVLVSNLLSSNRYQYDLSSTALSLMAGEYVTDVRMVFGTVPAGFKVENAPSILMYVLPQVYNGYKLIGRVEAGGQYNGFWYTGTALWTTVIQSKYQYGANGTAGYGDPNAMMNTAGINYPTVLPKTGY